MTPSVPEVELEAKARISEIRTTDDLERFRIEFLGKKGKIPALLELLKNLPQDERRTFGQSVNALKNFAESSLQALKTQLGSTPKSADYFDHTLPAIRPVYGRMHPLTQTIREILSIFSRLGFESVEGPEVESEFYNFTALNVPPDHPARDPQDTFYTESGHLLRTQTSTVQIRVMKDRKPPLRIVAPGRVYRPDTVDASHSFMFHQIEGLYVDTRVTFADLKGVLNLFLRELFGSDIKTRFRPHYFPFTEPSVEVDIAWSKKGWLEILGAGSVDPNVFKAVGYPAKNITGFAFGLGVERIAMLRHGVSDIRAFYENDLRFLRQF